MFSIQVEYDDMISVEQLKLYIKGITSFSFILA